MPTRDLLPAEWEPFFEELSRTQRARIVDLEVFGKEIGAQMEARNVPFKDVAIERRGPGRVELTIELGNGHDTPLSHVIGDVLKVREKVTPGGVPEAVEIESSDGVETLVRFHEALGPDAGHRILSAQRVR